MSDARFTVPFPDYQYQEGHDDDEVVGETVRAAQEFILEHSDPISAGPPEDALTPEQAVRMRTDTFRRNRAREDEVDPFEGLLVAEATDPEAAKMAEADAARLLQEQADQARHWMMVEEIAHPWRARLRRLVRILLGQS